jgi:hypothetical protein
VLDSLCNESSGECLRSNYSQVDVQKWQIVAKITRNNKYKVYSDVKWLSMNDLNISVLHVMRCLANISVI